MLKKYLKEAVVIILGKQFEEISNLLDTKKHINEFIIAKKLDITINQTRNLLYKLSDKGVVSSIRKKDKRKGWYTYFWKTEIIRSLEFLKNIFANRRDQLNFQIKSRETKQFYSCEDCNIEFNEESALIHNFTCNECGNVFTLKDNTKFLKELKRSSDRLKNELKMVDEEIVIEKEKIEKQREKIMKKEKKEKEIKRKEKREATKKKQKKKTIKKTIKKTLKKKIKKITKKKKLKISSKKKLAKKKTFKKKSKKR